MINFLRRLIFAIITIPLAFIILILAAITSLLAIMWYMVGPITWIFTGSMQLSDNIASKFVDFLDYLFCCDKYNRPIFPGDPITTNKGLTITIHDFIVGKENRPLV